MSEKRTKYNGRIANNTRFLNNTCFTNLHIKTYINTVTCRPIVRQRLGKHNPARANAQQWDVYC
jgi:hypothetical protein